jgi:hypothetical protein
MRPIERCLLSLSAFLLAQKAPILLPIPLTPTNPNGGIGRLHALPKSKSLVFIAVHDNVNRIQELCLRGMLPFNLTLAIIQITHR